MEEPPAAAGLAGIRTLDFLVVGVKPPQQPWLDEADKVTKKKQRFEVSKNGPVEQGGMPAFARSSS